MESWAWFCKKTAEISAKTSTSLQLTVSFVLTWLIRSSHMASLHIVEYSFPVPQSIGGLSWPMRHIAIADYYVCRKQSTALTHTHTHLAAPIPGLPGWAGTRKAKPIWILLKQERVSGSGISWAICKSAPRSRQITTPTPHRSVFFTGWMPILPPNQQCQSTEGKMRHIAVANYCICRKQSIALTHTHTHLTAPFPGLQGWAGTRKAKPIWILLKHQWHRLGHMQVCNSLQTDNHAITPPLSFYRPDALPTQPTASKHWRHESTAVNRRCVSGVQGGSVWADSEAVR